MTGTREAAAETAAHHAATHRHAAAHAATASTAATEAATTAAEAAHAAVAATEGAEAPGEGQHHVPADGQGTGLGVEVLVLRRAQVLALAQDVIGIQGDRRGVVDDRAGEAGVPDQAGRLVGLIAVVPVVVRIGGEGESVRPHGPVHGTAHGVVPGGVVLQAGLGYAVPGLGEPGPAVRA